MWRYEKISNQLANKGILVTQMHCILKKSISERGTQVGALVIGNLGNYKQRFQNKCIVHYKRKHMNAEHAIFLASPASKLRYFKCFEVTEEIVSPFLMAQNHLVWR